MMVTVVVVMKALTMAVLVAASQVWLLTLVSLVAVVLVMARVATTEANLYNTKSRNSLDKAAIWGLKAFTQEGETQHSPNGAFTVWGMNTACVEGRECVVVE